MEEGESAEAKPAPCPNAVRDGPSKPLARESVDPVVRAAMAAKRTTRALLRQMGLDLHPGSFPTFKHLLGKQTAAQHRAVPLPRTSQHPPAALQELLKSGPAGAGELIPVGERYPDNYVTTAKYTLVTFLPIFLFELFSRVAYLYFLLQTALSWWSEISPFNPYGGTIALVFVVAISGVRAAIEDIRRHKQDTSTNNSTTHVVGWNGRLHDVQWSKVQVGQVVCVRGGEALPADLLCLATSAEEGVAFVRTVNLDGETNLKTRRPILDLSLLADDGTTVQAAAALQAESSHGSASNTVDDQSVASAESSTVAGPARSRTQTQQNGNLGTSVDDRKSSLSASATSLSELGSQADAGAAREGTLDAAADTRDGDWVDSHLQATICKVLGAQGVMTCELPSKDMHRFQGSLQLLAPGEGSEGPMAPHPAALPVTINELLLRGSLLSNTAWVLGLVVYAGPDTRIQRNTARPPLKQGSLDRMLNLQITIVILFQLLLSIATAIAGYAWRQRQGLSRPHLGLDDSAQGNWQSPGAYIPLNTLTMWILYSYLVPISLFVTVEIVKYMQSEIYISRDPRLSGYVGGGGSSGGMPREQGTARNSGLNEDLGRVSFVFSDKTGTLTQNDMRLRQLSASGRVSGQPPSEFRLEEHEGLPPGPQSLAAWDKQAAALVQQTSTTSAWRYTLQHGYAPGGPEAGAEAAAEGHAQQEQEACGLLQLMLAILCCNSVILEPAASKHDSDEEEEEEGRGKHRHHRHHHKHHHKHRHRHYKRNQQGQEGGEEEEAPSHQEQRGDVSNGSHVVDKEHFGAAGAGDDQLSTKAMAAAGGSEDAAEGEHSQAPAVAGADVAVGDETAAAEADGQPAQLINYQGPSPDEVALLEGARRLGFELVSRLKGPQDKQPGPGGQAAAGQQAAGAGTDTASEQPQQQDLQLQPQPQGAGPTAGNGGSTREQDTGPRDALQLRVLGSPLTLQLLNLLEFSSERKRMSVVVRTPAGELLAYVKGADAVMLDLLRHDTPEHLLQAAHRDLSYFATQGLRTLVVGLRRLSPEWYADWDARYQAAAAALQDRDERVTECAVELEQELELLGVTAIEDRLQEGVAEAINTLLSCGICVWLITGDKRETAINIAVSAGLFQQGGLLTLTAQNPEEMASRLADLLAATDSSQPHKATHEAPAAVPAAAEQDSQQHGPQGSHGPPRSPGQLRQRQHAKTPAAAAADSVTSMAQVELQPQPRPQEQRQPPQQQPQDGPAMRHDHAEPAGASSSPSATSAVSAGSGAAGQRGAAGGAAGLSSEGRRQLVVDGKALNFVLADAQLTQQLAQLCSRCSSVLVCRASPSQKAAMLQMMRRHTTSRGHFKPQRDGPHKAGRAWWRCGPLRRWVAGVRQWIARQYAPVLLAIGDGANDVAMLQAADVGIGLLGREGRQAANCADYVLPQFSCLVPLLQVHGGLCRHRLARLTTYSFYKNVACWAVLFLYQPFCGWSGQAVFDDISAAIYNVVFTGLPILLYALLDRHASDADLLAHPELYASDQPALTQWQFWTEGVGLGVLHGALAFLLPYFGAVGPDAVKPTWSLAFLSKCVFTSMLGAVTLELAVTTRYWTWLYGIILALCFVLVFPFMAVLPYVERWVGYWDAQYMWQLPTPLYACATFWISLLTVLIVVLGTRLLWVGAHWLWLPDVSMRIAQARHRQAKVGRHALVVQQP